MSNSVRDSACELIGTFALTFIGAGAIVVNSWTGGQPGLVGIALAHGLVLSIVCTATMNLSGAHINPAVTIAMFCTRRIGFGGALCYILSQCVGATIAGFLLAYIFDNVGVGGAAINGKGAIEASNLGTPAFNPAIVTPMVAVLVEAILTFLLVFSIFGTAVDSRAPRIGGFGIGLAVTFDILAGGPITGAAMNPARVLGTLIGGGSATSELWTQHWVYWLGPIIGALLAAILYEALIMEAPSRKA